LKKDPAIKKEARKTALQLNKEAVGISKDLMKLVAHLDSAGMKAEAHQLQTRLNNYVRASVNRTEFLQRHLEWQMENPGKAMDQALSLNAKVIKQEGEIQHKHFVMVHMENPEDWKRKAIDVTVEGSEEQIPWEHD
jgi:hypothetical protein